MARKQSHDTGQASSVLQPFLILIGAFLLIAYLVGALNSGNWLWFSPVQPDYEPSRILVRERGQSIEYRPGDPGFGELAAALDTVLSDFTNADLVPLGLSDVTLQEYQETAVVMEIFYPGDIRFNTPVRMRNLDRLLIPIEGRHAGKGYVFLGNETRWLSGALIMADPEPLMDALRGLGHIQ